MNYRLEICHLLNKNFGGQRLWIYTNIANIIDFVYIAYCVAQGTNTSYTMVGALAQVTMNSALLFNSIYAEKVWAKYSK